MILYAAAASFLLALQASTDTRFHLASITKPSLCSTPDPLDAARLYTKRTAARIARTNSAWSKDRAATSGGVPPALTSSRSRNGSVLPCPVAPFACSELTTLLSRNPKLQYVERTYLKRKEVDDVLGGEDSWKNVDSTAGKPPSAS
jgi:hypothetical protein